MRVSLRDADRADAVAICRICREGTVVWRRFQGRSEGEEVSINEEDYQKEEESTGWTSTRKFPQHGAGPKEGMEG